MLTKVLVGSNGVQRKFFSMFLVTSEVSHCPYKHIHFVSQITDRVGGLHSYQPRGLGSPVL